MTASKMVMQRTPSWIASYAVIFSSLLAGASIVHNIIKPDLTIPSLVTPESNGSGIESPDQSGSVKVEDQKTSTK